MNDNSTDRYSDIINLPHHTSSVHAPMSQQGRAAQFAPFAALSGYDELIADSAVPVAPKAEEEAAEEAKTEEYFSVRPVRMN